MKGHNDKWRMERKSPYGTPGLAWSIYSAEGFTGAFVFEDEARLATAAPDMARALLDHVLIHGGPDDAHAHTKPCWASRLERTRQRLDGLCTADCSAVRAALHKAGVPLP